MILGIVYEIGFTTWDSIPGVSCFSTTRKHTTSLTSNCAITSAYTYAIKMRSLNPAYTCDF